MRAPDAAFADARLAVLYDALHEPRNDLDAYVAIAEEIGARTVVDIGCGTGSLALRLAALGHTVFGVDPAGASLEVARAKPDAERVTWVNGVAADLVAVRPDADLVVMTGNVAQVFVEDDDWATTLDAVHAVLRPGGWFAFETRRPERCDWEQWDVPATTITLPGGRAVTFCRIVTEVALPLVTFEAVTTVDGQPLASVSTLRFRSRRDVEADLVNHGFEIAGVREAPDRPGQELVFLARRRD